MKSFKEIRVEYMENVLKIDDLDIKIAEEKCAIKELIQGNTLKERIEMRQECNDAIIEHNARIDMYKTHVKQLMLENKVHINNGKVALFHEIYDDVVSVMEKYNGKPYGPKTKKKIMDEIRKKTGCWVYINDSYYRQELTIAGSDRYQGENITVVSAYENGSYYPFLVDNKVNVDGFRKGMLEGGREFIDDPVEYVGKLQDAHRVAYEAMEKLKAACDAYNKIALPDMATLSYHNTIYDSII